MNNLTVEQGQKVDCFQIVRGALPVITEWSKCWSHDISCFQIYETIIHNIATVRL